MTTAQALSPRVLYRQDETAWLEATANLIRSGRLDEAAAETGLPAEAFPAGCPYTLEQLLAADVIAE